MTITVHQHVSQTGNQNTASQEGSATEGLQRTLNWDFWLGIKQRMETEVGQQLNCHTVTNTIQMVRKLQLETPRHWPQTSLYVPQALHGLESHSQPTALEPHGIAYTNSITVCHSSLITTALDRSPPRLNVHNFNPSWSSILMPLFWPFMYDSDKVGWDHVAGKSVPHTSATAQNTLSWVKLSCIKWGWLLCCLTEWQPPSIN
jgi:hypothetical protein